MNHIIKIIISDDRELYTRQLAVFHLATALVITITALLYTLRDVAESAAWWLFEWPGAIEPVVWLAWLVPVPVGYCP